MAGVTLYHNPACSKSRGALEILQQRGVDAQVVEYLKQPPGREDLRRLLRLLPGPARELVRRDARFRELGLDPERLEDEEAVIGLLEQHPELMQRPVAVRGDRAVIARPSQRVLDLWEPEARP